MTTAADMPAAAAVAGVGVAPAGLVTVIRPQRGLMALDLGSIWRRRELAWVLAARDVRVRYKQTLLGAAWAIVQPVATMLVLHVFFGELLGVADRAGPVAYPVFLYAGLLPWTLFTSSLNGAATSLVNNAHIITKVYFPRLLLPLSATASPLIDYALASTVLAGLMVWFGVPFTAGLALLPLVVAGALLAALSVGIPLAACTVVYRDARHALPLAIQLWLFVTPVIYPVTLLPPGARWVLQLNPIAGPVEAGRAVVLGQPIDWAGWGVSTAVSLALLTAGLVWFSRIERKLADVA